jgi:lysophospholipase L1-like esterase
MIAWSGWILSVILIIVGIFILNRLSKLPSLWTSYHYKERVSYFKELNNGLKDGGIVFLGDSITEQFIVSEFFPDHYVINRGISGDTTEGVLKRLEESVYNIKPSKIFLLIGVNDLGNEKDIDHIGKNIDIIITKILDKLPHTDIIVQSVYPVHKDKHNKIKKRIVGKRNNKDIDKLNRSIINIANKHDIDYIDMNTLLQDSNGNLDFEYTIEGLHLTPLGYRIVVKEISKYL